MRIIGFASKNACRSEHRCFPVMLLAVGEHRRMLLGHCDQILHIDLGAIESCQNPVVSIGPRLAVLSFRIVVLVWYLLDDRTVDNAQRDHLRQTLPSQRKVWDKLRDDAEAKLLAVT